jgi:tripartite ATP-independent transporter DctP family solute receptor
MISRRSVGAGLVAAPAIFSKVHAQQTTTLRVAHVLSTAEPAHDAALAFADRVTKRSDGRMKLEVFGQGQLGGNKEQHELMRQGANVMILTDPSGVGDYVPDWGVLNGPYLLADPLEYRKILASPWYREMIDRAAQQRLRVLTMNGFFGARHALANKPLRNPNDMKGVAFRVPPTQMWLETFKALGTRPVTVAWPEVYSALQQGVADAVEAPLASLWGSKLHETRKVLSLTNHFNAWVGLVMNEQVFRRLPEASQSLLVEEAINYGNDLTQRTMASAKELEGRFEAAGVQIVRDIDIKAMAEATASVYSAIPGWSQGLYQRVRGILTS